MQYLGWVASVVKLFGWWELGHKHRRGWLLYIIGTTLWCLAAWDRMWWDLLFLEGITLLVLTRNWVKWGKDARLDG